MLISVYERLSHANKFLLLTNAGQQHNKLDDIRCHLFFMSVWSKNAALWDLISCVRDEVLQKNEGFNSSLKFVTPAKINSAAPPCPQAFSSSPAGPHQVFMTLIKPGRPRKETTAVAVEMCRQSRLIREWEIMTHKWCASRELWRHLAESYLVILGLKNVTAQTKATGFNYLLWNRFSFKLNQK